VKQQQDVSDGTDSDEIPHNAPHGALGGRYCFPPSLLARSQSDPTCREEEEEKKEWKGVLSKIRGHFSIVTQLEDDEDNRSPVGALILRRYVHVMFLHLSFWSCRWDFFSLYTVYIFFSFSFLYPHFLLALSHSPRYWQTYSSTATFSRCIYCGQRL